MVLTVYRTNRFRVLKVLLRMFDEELLWAQGAVWLCCCCMMQRPCKAISHVPPVWHYGIMMQRPWHLCMRSGSSPRKTAEGLPSCSPIMLTHHAHPSCSPIMRPYHTRIVPPHHALPIMPPQHALASCPSQRPPAQGLPFRNSTSSSRSLSSNARLPWHAPCDTPRALRHVPCGDAGSTLRCV